MAKPGIQMWTLLVLFCETYMGQVSASNNTNCPIHYMASVPGILESGSKNSFCLSLSQPSYPVLLKVILKGLDSQKILLRKRTSNGFHKCYQFLVPSVKAEEQQLVEVSVKGKSFYSREIKRVLIKTFQPKTIIQTDKPIYNQGQTVEFRVVTLGTNLKPVEGHYDAIVIRDPHNNRIAQWTNQTAAAGTILQLYYPLGNEALEGYYRIIVQIGRNRVFHTFKVQKYGLPKFDVVVTIPKEISVGQETFEVTACGIYTYGQPVDGNVTLRICRPLRNQNSCRAPTSSKNDVSITSLCRTTQKQACNKGCATFVYKVSNFTRPDPKPFLDVLDLSATVVDRLTCASYTQWERIKITYLVGRLFFKKVPKTYSQGTNLDGKVRVVDYLGNPVPQMTVYLFVGKKGSPFFADTLKTNHKGIANFSLETEDFRGEMQLYASSTDNLEPPGKNVPYYDVATVTVYESGPGRSACGFLRVVPIDRPLRCYRQEEITIQYSLEQHLGNSLDIVYLILSRGIIVHQGFVHLHMDYPKIQGEFSFNLTVRTRYAPSIQVVAYTVLECERVLAHSERFHTKDCFSNPVLPKFLPSPVFAGEDVKLCIKAKPNSVCGVSLIDLNLLARADVSNLDANQIYGYLPIRKPEPLPSELVDEPECVEVKPRTSYFAFTNQEKEDANTVFTTQGLQLLTNLPIQNPTCLKLGGKKYHEAMLSRKIKPQYSERRALERRPIPDPGRLSYTCYDELEPVYKLSTETWLFHLVKVGETGQTCVSYAVPNIVTTWNTEVFCVSPHTFGLARPVLLSVFKPFSLDFKLPYVMIWGESLKLKSIVHNYLPTSLKIKITAAASSSYILTPLSTDQCTFCLCAGEHKVIRWTFTPTYLGDLTVSLTAEVVSSQTSCCDQEVTVPESGHSIVVTRPLKVKAVGYEIIKTHSWLLCPKGHCLSEKLETHIPNNVISGCLKAKVSVSGSILSRSVENLGDLLYLPYGCGEQNIAFMAIDTYILHYLQKTHTLSQETKKKGINYLTTGYQRQLAYRKKTGAFSTFEKGEENTWLTAFVMVTFYKAQSFIYIDPKIIEEARKWLECQQRDNGCFKVSGKLYNNYIRGDVPDEVTVTAYVTAGLLETNIPADNPVVKKSLSCLKDYIYDFSNTYTTALLAYVFTLAENWEARCKLLNYLDSVAIREGDLQYWCLTPKQNPRSLCVEISSYVLLAKVGDSLSEGDLSCSLSILRWLIKQQSYYGGFESTQDTAVAIKAMTLYSSKVLNREGSSSVTVSSPTDHLSFQVNQNNKLDHQELVLQGLKGKYWLRAEGTSCSVVQVTFVYNVPVSAVVSSLSVEAKVEIHNCCHDRLVTLKLKSSYSEGRSSTNMVVLDIAVPSGFWPVPASLWNLKKGVLVSNVEHKDGHVFVYLQELQKDIPVFHELEMIQEYEVQHLRPSTVTIYDYYCPSVKGVTEYCGKNCYEIANSYDHYQPQNNRYKPNHQNRHDHQSHHHDSHYHPSHQEPPPHRYHSRRRYSHHLLPFHRYRHGSHNLYHNYPRYDNDYDYDDDYYRG
ncbi:alpha-2-macroglobulin-like [Poecilia latipinna]|uniref:alpha-2-macroglobulin-like n=1 Tax=Poecilia latipinna TaxID=48699 RepID=UPI00072DF1AA|nr:PREDICTED: alpha-2-macroglobulin-like [Poecilia latipinna]